MVLTNFCPCMATYMPFKSIQDKQLTKYLNSVAGYLQTLHRVKRVPEKGKRTEKGQRAAIDLILESYHCCYQMY